MNSVPDRWLAYKAYGKVIKGTNIVAFKVPLKEAIATKLKPEQRFTTAILLETFPHLKCIVDLTNTCRYYDKEEVLKAGVRYKKIMIPGHAVPPLDMIKTFFKVMDDFSSSSAEGELIGVHCTHGVNRTGYLICRYLIQQLGWELRDSLKAFEEARGHPIERGIYVAALESVPRGKRIETTSVKLPALKQMKKPIKRLLDHRSRPSIGLQFLPPSRPDVPPFHHQPFGFGPSTPLIPPPPLGMPPPMSHNPPFGLRPFRCPVQMRPAMAPVFPNHPSFSPRLPGPPRPHIPLPRLLPGLSARLPPPKLPHRPTLGKRSVLSRKDLDFTVDTFEENLLGVRRRRRGPFAK